MFVFAFAYSHRFQLPHFSCYLQLAMYCTSTVLAHPPPLPSYPSYRHRCSCSGICPVSECMLCSFDLQLHTFAHTQCTHCATVITINVNRIMHQYKIWIHIFKHFIINANCETWRIWSTALTYNYHNLQQAVAIRASYVGFSRLPCVSFTIAGNKCFRENMFQAFA